MKKISIIGLGKLGLPWLSVLVEKGFDVIGVDKNKSLLQQIKNGKNPYYEEGLEEFFSKRYNFQITDNIYDAVFNTDITFIIVPTPSDDSGKFSNKYIIEVLNDILSAIKNKNDYHLIVITSTIMPASMEKVIIPYIEKNSGKRCSIDFGVCYNPEFIALGEVRKGMMFPDFVLIGESDKKAGDILENIYKNVCENNPPIKRMNFINAEICKIAVNSFITMKISFANMLGELCDRISNASANIITDAMGCDTRIGKKYFSPGGKYGGPCFPRDNIAFTKFFQENRLIAELPMATDQINKRQTMLIFEKIKKFYKEGMTIGIAGISYKEKTDITEKSQGIELLEYLLNNSFLPINIYNFGYPYTYYSLNHKDVTFFSNEKDFINHSDIIVKILRNNFKESLDNKIVIDIWER
jgi:UDPglucose 6-dehydrogenase